MIARPSSGMISPHEEARRDVAQSGSALGWGPSGRRFESGRPDSSKPISGKATKALDTIYLLLGIVGFMAVIAAFFFGGFLLLDFIWGRRGGDA